MALRRRAKLTLLINLLLHLRAETDRAHNPIPKLFIHDRLVRIPIVLHDLIQPVHQRLFRWHLHLPAPVWHSHHLRLEELLFRYLEDLGEVLDIFGRGSGLAVEEGRNGHFLATESLADGLKGEVLGLFGFEEDGGLGGKAREDVLLFSGISGPRSHSVVVVMSLTFNTAMGCPDDVPCCVAILLDVVKLLFCWNKMEAADLTVARDTTRGIGRMDNSLAELKSEAIVQDGSTYRVQ